MLPIHKRMSQAKSPNMCVCVCVCYDSERESVWYLWNVERNRRERESERVTLWLPFGCFERHTPLRGPLDNRKTDQTVNV